MAGSAVAWSIYMRVYAQIKDHYEEQGHTLHVGHIAVASLTGGVVGMLVTNPIWMVKTRLQLQGTHRHLDPHYVVYKGPKDAILRIYKEEGPLAFYKGIIPALLSAYHGFVQFATYEAITNAIIKRTEDDNVRGYVAFIGGGLSKVAAMLGTYPLMVVRTRLQDERGLTIAERRYKGFLWTIHHVAKNEGLVGFYKGLSPSLMRLGLNSSVFFLLFEKIKESLALIPQLTKE